jgi:hypothetical protein
VGRDIDHALAADHAHLFSAAGPQDEGGITAVVPGQLNEVAQNLAPFLLGRTLEPGAELPDNGMTFSHDQPHGSRPPDSMSQGLCSLLDLG